MTGRFFIACNTIASHSFLLLRCKRIAVQRKAYTCRYGLRFSLRCSCRVPAGTQHTYKRPRSKSTLVSLFPGFNCIFVFRPMATSHQAAVCCFFVFACAKVIIHSITNARTGTLCLSINLHAIRVVFTRSNSCIHSVITLFFAHQKSKTDCDADGSDQKKTQYNGNKQKSQHQLSFKMRTFSKHTTPNVERF